jgi:hypothetical protein
LQVPSKEDDEDRSWKVTAPKLLLCIATWLLFGDTRQGEYHAGKQYYKGKRRKDTSIL